MVAQGRVDLPQHHVREVAAGRLRAGQLQQPGAQQVADIVVVVEVEQQGRQVKGTVTGSTAGSSPLVRRSVPERSSQPLSQCAPRR